MKKLKGPELKLPELKVPTFLADLYYDLRDRRLLPLVALVVVAIAAVPFLLGGNGEEAYVVPPASLSALGSSAEKTSKLTVVEATPGLRDYRKRLADRSATNPFKQRYTGLPASAQVESSGSGSEGGGGGSATTVTETGTTEGSAAGPSGGSGASGGSTGGQAPRLIEFVIDVQISHAEAGADGGQGMSEPEVRRRVPSLTQLPGKKTPVVTTGGLNLHNGKVFLLVSNEVKSLDGEFACLARTPTGICELLEIERGFPLELVYGPNDILYRIKVTKVDAIWDGTVGDRRSSRAAFVAPSAAALPAGSGSVSKIAPTPMNPR